MNLFVWEQTLIDVTILCYLQGKFIRNVYNEAYESNNLYY